MVPIKQNLVSSNKYSIKCPYAMNPEGITVHNTANKASAKNEIAYMIENNNETSYHYAVDDVEIIQGIPENRNAWHAGDGGSGKGNRKTIGIEICYSTGDKTKFEKAQENAAEFVAYKLKEKGWGTDRVYPHKHWSGKHCPHRTLDEYGWDYFINLVNKYLKGGSSDTTTEVVNNNIIYQTWDDVKNVWLPNVTNNSDYAGIFGHDICAIYANLAEGTCVYKVHTQGGSWLSEVKNREDYAGIFNKPIDGFMIKATDPNTQIYYQVHIRGGNWLSYVTGYSETDSNNGYAGIMGRPIDAIRMYARTHKTQIVKPITPTNPTTTEAKEYQVVTEINRYDSAADAQSKINSKGLYEIGTYYIFNKYPNGLNGMYNISTDKTGASAGSWINPSENKAVEVQEEIQKLYRVRKSKDDAKTQKGAFSDLENAKECCQKAGEGYSVFDWNWTVVYTYVAPKQETPKQEEVPTIKDVKVYDLPYSEKHQIIEHDIVQIEDINEKECTRAIVAINKNNPNFDVEIAKAFFLLADEYHIDPMRAISQSILETGWFKFVNSSVKPEQHNYCGLGATGGGASGASFDTIENGVRAQLQHLYAYGCKDELPDGETTIVDPRFKYVTRGIATYWEQLAGRWAVPGFDGDNPEASMKAGTTYGQKIDRIYETLKATSYTEDDVKRYFPEEIEPVEPVNPVEPITPIEPEDDKDISVNWLTKLIKTIIDILFGLFKGNK